MINKIEVSAVHAEIDDDLEKYVTKKIAHLDHYLPKAARESAHAQVKLKESKAKNKKQCECEVILHLPKENLMAKESTINMYAAIDIVEATLKNQIKKYKETHEAAGLHRRMARRFKRR